MNKKLIIPLTFAIGLGLGGAGTHFYKEHQEAKDPITVTQKKFDNLYSNLFNDNFFSDRTSPFEQMEKLRAEMDKKFNEGAGFDNWFADKFGGSINEIKQDEDDKFVYYRLDLEGLDKDSVKIDVINGQVNISGEKSDIQAEEDPSGGGTRSEFYQSFQRSFPVPEGVDSDKVDFKTEGDQIVVKFPKVEQKATI
ncbi:MAG TPA: Hsp20/alpha crystallin family protein [Bacteriovoracaceae bacterium]|nr:Hsp20/alpha crystallin family protein [Bacteriovoracaceae bacterium]